LAAKASRGQSITAAGNTVLARIINGRALINTLKQGTLFGAIGSAGAKSGITATLINMTAAFKLQQLGVKREEQLNQIIGEMLKDPNLLDLAKAPPTKTNFAKLAEELGRRGYISSQEDTE
jgi:hypothetical protein